MIQSLSQWWNDGFTTYDVAISHQYALLSVNVCHRIQAPMWKMMDQWPYTHSRAQVFQDALSSALTTWLHDWNALDGVGYEFMTDMRQISCNTLSNRQKQDCQQTHSCQNKCNQCNSSLWRQTDILGIMTIHKKHTTYYFDTVTCFSASSAVQLWSLIVSLTLNELSRGQKNTSKKFSVGLEAADRW